MIPIETHRRFLRSLGSELPLEIDEKSLKNFNLSIGCPDGRSHTLPKDVSESVVRGYCDAMILRGRYHDESLHQSLAEKSPDLQSYRDLMECNRVIAIGSLQYSGMRKNLQEAFRFYLKHLPFDSPEIFEIFNIFQQSMLENCADISHFIPSQKLSLLKKNLYEQALFHQTLEPIYKQWSELFWKKDVVPISSRSEESAAIDSEDSESFVPMDQNSGESIDMDTEKRFVSESPFFEVSRQWMLSNGCIRLHTSYGIFTNAYDELLSPFDLLDKNELQSLYLLLKKQYRNHQQNLQRCVSDFQRVFMAKSRQILSSSHEGSIDLRSLTQIIANPLREHSYQSIQTHFEKNIAISILIDSSGSMRGKRIVLSALCADFLIRLFAQCQISCEVLGFTTTDWQGGQPKSEWNHQKMPMHVGRLNSLRHLIYQPFDGIEKNQCHGLGLMMKESLLKENIDGEALLWAHNRLVLRKEPQKILLVICDGLPVDGATLIANHRDLLSAHLKHVIGMIESYSPVQLIGIGIEHQVQDYYQNHIELDSPEELGPSLINRLMKVILRPYV